MALDHLARLEAESIFILREVLAQAERPVMLYSIGKDSSVLLHLASKAFAPCAIPFPLLHIDTGYKFEEMYAFRDKMAERYGARLEVYRNEEAIAAGAHPSKLGTQRCCALLKTKALLDGLAAGRYDAAIGGARRDEERSRAKERVFSFRDKFGQWEPRDQRPELWNLYNGNLHPGQSVRVFPLSNWTELDVWNYIERESIEVVPLYYSKSRQVVRRGNALFPVDSNSTESIEVICRFRTLGCQPCTGAVESEATTLSQVIDEMAAAKTSERALRIIDHDSEGSMERKKKEGYF